jgi:hypothetical protein
VFIKTTNCTFGNGNWLNTIGGENINFKNNNRYIDFGITDRYTPGKRKFISLGSNNNNITLNGWSNISNINISNDNSGIEISNSCYIIIGNNN